MEGHLIVWTTIPPNHIPLKLHVQLIQHSHHKHSHIMDLRASISNKGDGLHGCSFHKTLIHSRFTKLSGLINTCLNQTCHQLCDKKLIPITIKFLQLPNVKYNHKTTNIGIKQSMTGLCKAHNLGFTKPDMFNKVVF